MRLLLIASLALCSANALAGDPTDPETLRTAITRGLDFLAKDSIAWREQYKCASCHHASLVVWSFRDAKSRGYAVDETLLADLNQQMSEAGDGKFAGERPADAPKGFNAKAVYFSLALAQNPDLQATSHEGTKLLLSTVKSDQTENGSWSHWPGLRQPIFVGSDECITALELLSLLAAAEAGDTEAVAARDKGVAWLSEHSTDDDPQTLALRTILWSKLGRPAEESRPFVEKIRSRQNADGGWSQTTEMASDAWATGQALYALAASGAPADDPALAHGQQFLISTQREDGGWAMTSRPMKPGGEGGKNLVPITGGGSAWAVLGLVQSAR
jgi:hypothetical protein